MSLEDCGLIAYVIGYNGEKTIVGLCVCVNFIWLQELAHVVI